jgi:hypothetical protein
MKSLDCGRDCIVVTQVENKFINIYSFLLHTLQEYDTFRICNTNVNIKFSAHDAFLE